MLLTKRSSYRNNLGRIVQSPITVPKLGGAVKHLIDISEKRICPLSFEFLSTQIIERCSKLAQD